MNVKVIVLWAVIAFVAWWVLIEPSSAAHVIYNIGMLLRSTAHGVAGFIPSKR